MPHLDLKRFAFSFMTLSMTTLVTTAPQITHAAGDLSSICETKINAALHFLGKPTLDDSNYRVVTQQGDWIALSSLVASEQIEFDRKEAFEATEAARSLLLKWSQQNTKLGGDPSELSVNSRAQFMRSNEEGSTKRTAIAFIQEANAQDIMVSLTNIVRQKVQCRVHPDASYAKAIAEITASIENCKTLKCSSNILNELKESEATISQNRETARQNRENCRQAEVDQEQLRKTARPILSQMEKPATKIVPVSVAINNAESNARTACIQKYQSTEGNRRFQEITKRVAALEKICQSVLTPESACQKELIELRTELKRVDVYEICGYDESRTYQDNTKITLLRNGDVVIDGHRQTAQGGDRQQMNLRTADCQFIGEGKYNHRTNKYAPNEAFATPEELARYQNGCAMINTFSDRPKQCAQLSEPTVSK